MNYELRFTNQESVYREAVRVSNFDIATLSQYENSVCRKAVRVSNFRHCNSFAIRK